MGWVDEVTYRHEGWAAGVDADGATIMRPSADGTAYPASWWWADGQDGRPRAVAMRAVCECGWTSETTHPLPDGAHDDPDADEDVFERPVYEDWRAHTAAAAAADPDVPPEVHAAVTAALAALHGVATTRPLAALTAARLLTEGAEQATRQAVISARAAGRSWADIARPLALHRQSVYERYRADTP